jgi:hypothetical protein
LPARADTSAAAATIAGPTADGVPAAGGGGCATGGLGAASGHRGTWFARARRCGSGTATGANSGATAATGSSASGHVSGSSGTAIGTPACSSHDQRHFQLCAAAARGAPKHAEVQSHSQFSGPAGGAGSGLDCAGGVCRRTASTTWSTTFWTPAWLIWTTGPSSPGLLIRIETLTLEGWSCFTLTSGGVSL